jgi:ABC-type Na+ transport system ATPase subunit NatA
MAQIIEVNHLIKTFKDVRAVSDISFDVRKGEFFGLLGPNGAGKTTTIRMLYGFSPPSDGSIRVFDLDITKDWRKIKARIGICQQENTLDPDLTVEQNLVIFAGYFYIPSKKAKKRCRELLQFFALTHKKDAGVMELSGGQVIEVEGAEPALMDYVKANRVEYDDLGDRVIVYTSVGSAPCDSIKDNFCSEKCVYRSSTLEDVFLRLTGRELRE